jgi:hypothetical protein
MRTFGISLLFAAIVNAVNLSKVTQSSTKQASPTAEEDRANKELLEQLRGEDKDHKKHSATPNKKEKKKAPKKVKEEKKDAPKKPKMDKKEKKDAPKKLGKVLPMCLAMPTKKQTRKVFKILNYEKKTLDSKGKHILS